MTEWSPTLPKYWCGLLMVVICLRKMARLIVDPEKIGKRQDTDVCGNMTPSVRFQETSVLAGAKF